MTTAAIYTRLSVEVTNETSRERQEADARAYAQARGWDVVRVHTDLLSGFKDVLRPGFEAFMTELRTGTVDVGLVWKLDRLTRKGVTGIAPVLDALKAGGTNLASVNDNIDTSTAMGQGVLALLASIAKQESENTSTRVTSAKAHAARQGKPVIGCFRAFGYARDGVSPVEEEAALVRQAALDVLAGRAVHDIAREWERAGVVGPAWTRKSGEEVPGTPMTGSSIHRILTSARIAGFREYKGTRYPATWPAILDPETAEAVSLALTRTARSGRARRYLLTGAVFCGVCGKHLTPRARSQKEGGERRYVCASDPGRRQACGKVTVMAEAVESVAEKVVLAGLEHMEMLVSPADNSKNRIGPLVDELRGLRDRLKVLEDAHFVDGTLTAGRFRELREGVGTRMRDLEGKIDALTAVGHGQALAGLVDVQAAWDSWSLEERRRGVRTVWPRIEVHPRTSNTGRRFDVGRVRFVDREDAGWRVVEGPSGPELRPEAWGDSRFLPL